MTLYYLDTSVAADIVMVDGGPVRWFEAATADVSSQVVSSRLLQTELTRVLRREGRPVSERELVLDHVDIVPITDAILTVAELITEHVKTLDAIHLASAVSLGSSVVVVSHDTNMLRLAEVFGLHTIDPVVQSSSTDPDG